MKNTLDDAEADSRPSSPKRIKLEQETDDASHLLSTSISTPLTQLKRRGRYPKSSSGDRAKALLEDPRISAVEPQQVLCRMCGHWIKLFKHIDYGPANWHTHAERCEPRSKWKTRVKQEPDCIFTLTIPPLSRVRSPTRNTALPRISFRQTFRKPEQQIVNKVPPRAPSPAPVSAADSSSQVRARGKTTEERKALLLADYRAFLPEPHQVLCGICKTWVKLHNSRPYDLWNWTRHIDRCGAKSAIPRSTNLTVDAADKSPADSPGPVTPVETLASAPDIVDSPAISEADVEAVVGDVELRDSDDETEPPNVGEAHAEESQPSAHVRVKSEIDDLELLYPAPEEPSGESISTAKLTKRKNKKSRPIEERRRALEDDQRCGEVRPHEVFCLGCNRWIQLYQNVAYIESNWSRHAERCFARKDTAVSAPARPGAVASSSKARVPTPLQVLNASVKKNVLSDATKRRMKELESDKHIKSVERHRVLCGLCNDWVTLRVHREYDNWNWRQHIAACTARQPSKNYSVDHYPNAKYGSIKVEDNGTSSSMSVRSLSTNLTAPPKLKTVKVKDESSPEDRRDILLADERCKDVEPDRVMCKVCLRHVGLHSKKLYSLANWYKHIQSCSRKAEKKFDGSSTSKVPFKTPLTAVGYLRAPARETQAVSVPVPIRIDKDQLDEIASIKQEGEPSLSEVQLKNSEERRQKMLQDQRIDILEPHRVRCKLCQNWFKLHKQFEYASYNWEKHIEICAKRVRTNGEGTSNSPILFKEEVEQTSFAELDPLASYNAKLSLRKRTTPEERFAFMQADSRIMTIEKHRAQCGLCSKWIKLQAKIEYEPHNWTAHVKKCEIRIARQADRTGASTSAAATVDLTEADAHMYISDVDANGGMSGEERRTMLVKDGKCSVVEPHRVLCGMCQQWIKLRDEREYVPFNWLKHKGRCVKRHLNVQSSENRTHPLNETVVIKEEPSSISLVSASNLRKRPDEQREAELRADSRQAGVEPGRVFCQMCKTWIKLNTATGFLPSNWLRHAQRCQRKTGWKNEQALLPMDPPELQPVEVVDLDTEEMDSGVFGFIELGSLVSSFEPTVSSTHYGIPLKEPAFEPLPKPMPTTYSLPTLRARPGTPSLSARPSVVETVVAENITGKRMHRSEQMRKDELEKDPRTKIVHTDRILCGMCDRWIQMRRDVSFSPQNWLKHAGICENRTGWSQRTKVDVTTKFELETPPRDILSNSRAINAAMPAAEVQEEIPREPDELPYNARIHMHDKPQMLDAPTPQFKPVKWEAGDAQTYPDDESSDSDISEVEEQHFGAPRPLVHQVRTDPVTKEPRPLSLAGEAPNALSMEEGILPASEDSLSSKEEPMLKAGEPDASESAFDLEEKNNSLTPDDHDASTVPISSSTNDKRRKRISIELDGLSNRNLRNPFTKAPLMRHGLMHGPFGHHSMLHARARSPARTPVVPMQPKKISTPLTKLQRPKTLPNGSSPTPASFVTPICDVPVPGSTGMPYLNILPHLLPKTMVYSYGKGSMPSPLLTPATPPVISPYPNSPIAGASSSLANALPTPPSTADSNDITLANTSETTAELASSSSKISTSPDAQSSILQLSDNPSGQMLIAKVDTVNEDTSSPSAYGPVKPGILQLAPLPPGKEMEP